MRVRFAGAFVAPIVFVLLLGSSAQAAPPPITEKCTEALKNANVSDVYKAAEPKPEKPVREVTLGQVIELKVSNLDSVLHECANQSLVLFLNGYSMTGLKPGPLTAPSEGALRFTLKFLDDARVTWVPILGYPGFKPRKVQVSFGVEGQYPVTASAEDTTLQLETIGNRWFVIWLILFLAMLAVFAWCVFFTNIIRDGSKAAQEAGIRSVYSLSKTQGAVWFFVILAAYLLIGLVTGDFFNSVNSTALILLGIGAGTVAGSAVIDAAKASQQEADTVKAVTDAKTRLATIDVRLKQIDTDLKDTNLTPEQTAALKKEQADKTAERTIAVSEFRKLTGENEHFLTDILSDANGVSFHRYQMAVWTVVLAFIFIKGVYENLAMPTFDTTLMGLLGLSAGTYLGLKIPEATTPKKDKAS